MNVRARPRMFAATRCIGYSDEIVDRRRPLMVGGSVRVCPHVNCIGSRWRSRRVGNRWYLIRRQHAVLPVNMSQHLIRMGWSANRRRRSRMRDHGARSQHVNVGPPKGTWMDCCAMDGDRKSGGSVTGVSSKLTVYVRAYVPRLVRGGGLGKESRRWAYQRVPADSDRRRLAEDEADRMARLFRLLPAFCKPLCNHDFRRLDHRPASSPRFSRARRWRRAWIIAVSD